MQDFLSTHPQMRLVEFCDDQVVIEGDYYLNAQMDGCKDIQSTHKIRVTFRAGHPQIIPLVAELDNSIPKHPDYHTYSDGCFCLGSNIRIKSILYNNPTAINFIEKVVEPFLYKIIYKLKYGAVPFGELDHNKAGVINDYQHLFGVKEKAAVIQVLRALGKRKREANKLLCPCDCGNRLGKCIYRFSLQQWRPLGKRRWFRKHLSELTTL